MCLVFHAFVLTRTMCSLSLQKGKKKSTDLRALAESWGCKVLSLNELLKELRKLKPLPKKEDTSKKSAGDKGSSSLLHIHVLQPGSYLRQ